MTAAQFALLAGGLIGLGLALGMLAFAPAYPSLRDYIQHLQAGTRPTSHTTVMANDRTDKIGLWIARHLPVTLTRWLRTPTKELAMLRIPVHRYYAQRAFYGLFGLLYPGLLAALLPILGIHLPIVIPVIACLAIAIAASFLPDLTIRSKAARARREFQEALTAYIDLVAIARNSGAQTRQAMEIAANTGESWAFARIQEELIGSRFSGRSPWLCLRDLAEELDVPGLADLADIMRLSAEDNAAVYLILRNKAAAMRNTITNDELAEANARTENMSYSQGLLPMIFLVLLGAPALMSILGLVR